MSPQQFRCVYHISLIEMDYHNSECFALISNTLAPLGRSYCYHHRRTQCLFCLNQRPEFAMTSAELLMQTLLERGVYFSLPSADAWYLSVCLAEGFEELGIPVRANVRAYPPPGQENRLPFQRNVSSPGAVRHCDRRSQYCGHRRI